ncbi:MAG: flagellin [Methanomicrobiales archaeon]|nr:flagellin [Methanomicrobiales archaeon]
MRQFYNKEDAFTGLEAAIVLIAFVVVAAVFSYVVLGAGFFTTQKSQEVVHTGVSQASSSIELIGNVYAHGDTGNGELDYLQFTVGTTAGGTGVDVTKMVITYKDEGYTDEITYNADAAKFDGDTCTPTEDLNAGEWTVCQVLNDNGNSNSLIEPREQFIIVVIPQDAATLTANTPFTIELKPAVGAVLPIRRTVPPAIETFNVLY